MSDSTRPYFFYTSTKGALQGAFPSESTRSGDRGALCYRFRFYGTASNEPTRKQTGAALHEPLTILKPWGPASPSYLQAFWTGEVLSEVVMEFVRRDPGGGRETPLETITLRNATIVSLKRLVGGGKGVPEGELDEIGLRFEQMEMKAKGARKSVRFDVKGRLSTVPEAKRPAVAYVEPPLAPSAPSSALGADAESPPAAITSPLASPSSPPGAGADASSAPTPPASEPSPSRTWIVVQLVGEDGEPIADEAYRIELPDGTVREGQLDSTGQSRIDDLDPGTCTVSFPRLDAEAWAPA